MGFRQFVDSLFLPPYRIAPQKTRFAGDPQQARKERPIRSQSHLYWLQDDIDLAITLADCGNLMRAAQLHAACKTDAVFSGIMSTRAGGLTRLPKIFRGTPNVLERFEARDDVSLFDQIFSPKELELLNADGINLGVGVGQFLTFEESPIPKFVRMSPEFLVFRIEEWRWYYRTAEGETLITPGDGRWVLHVPGGAVEPWKNALWVAMGRAFVSKSHADSSRDNYAGKLANPARVAKPAQGATEEQVQGFFEDLMAWGLNSVFSLPLGWDIELLESNGNGYEVFTQQRDAADQDIAIGLAGQIVTTTGGVGFANGDIHASIRADLIKGDGEALASTINEQGLGPIVDRLFGSGARGFVQWDTTPPADLAATAQVMTSLAAGIKAMDEALVSRGVQIDADEMVRRFSVPVRRIPIPESTSLPEARANPPLLAAPHESQERPRLMLMGGGK